MNESTPTTSTGLTPPPGFEYNPDILSDYDEQVQTAIERAAYQAAPLPSFEGVPTVDITPSFNPTGAPAAEIYARGRVPHELRPSHGVRSEFPRGSGPVEMWRIVERTRLQDGTGLVSSSILQANSLGDVEAFKSYGHLASNHERRMVDAEAATPFVSFSTDPEDLANNVILRHGFGVKGGRDSVVVQVRVDPDRVITGVLPKEPEVLLLGGVAPEEYVAAYTVEDFVSQVLPEGEVRLVTGESMARDKALGYWAMK